MKKSEFYSLARTTLVLAFLLSGAPSLAADPYVLCGRLIDPIGQRVLEGVTIEIEGRHFSAGARRLAAKASNALTVDSDALETFPLVPGSYGEGPLGSVFGFGFGKG